MKPAKRKRETQQGIALVTVLIAIAITLVMTSQFGTTTNIDLFAAANYRDQMRAHFLARSAQNLAELVIRLQQRLDNIKELSGMVQITDFADQIMLAFCGSPEEVQAAVGFSTSTTKGLGADVGTCGVVGQITTEDDKINLNCSNSTNAGKAATIKSAPSITGKDFPDLMRISHQPNWPGYFGAPKHASAAIGRSLLARELRAASRR
jgi:Tfp pilus assembly protein PilX